MSEGLESRERPADQGGARRGFAAQVVDRLRRAGFESYWAGGCVRDMLLGLEPADYDVATSATPQQVMGLFEKTVPVGVSFGVVRVRGPKDAGEVEVATFRRDMEYRDGRRPEGVLFTSAEVDASRRDFTINGMFYDPIDQRVIDFVGGEVDLHGRVVRAIGDPSARFDEDKLRLLRAVRFAARFGFRVEERTWEALCRKASEIEVIAAERIAQELRKLLVHSSRVRGVVLMRGSGLLGVLLPEVEALVKARGEEGCPPEALGLCWDQTLATLEALPEEPSFPLALAGLLHDAGWADGRILEFTKKKKEEGHAVVGSLITEEVTARLKLSTAEREGAAWLVGHHRALDRATELRRCLLKRLLASPGIEDLLALHRAIARAEGKSEAHLDFAESYLREEPEGPVDPAPLLTGDDLIALGLKPGRRFAEILSELRDAQLDGAIRSRAEAEAWLTSWLESNG